MTRRQVPKSGALMGMLVKVPVRIQGGSQNFQEFFISATYSQDIWIRNPLTNEETGKAVLKLTFTFFGIEPAAIKLCLAIPALVMGLDNFMKG
jgi:hypothetical protein